MLLATALALLITGCAQQTFYCSKQTGSSSIKEAITHHFFVSGIGPEENCRCSQNLWRRKKCSVKEQKPSKHS